jgi:hypothetical protein
MRCRTLIPTSIVTLAACSLFVRLRLEQRVRSAGDRPGSSDAGGRRAASSAGRLIADTASNRSNKLPPDLRAGN